MPCWRLTDFFEGNTVADVTPQTCGRYAEKRGRSQGTVRRELGVLRAAINYAHKNGRITRPVAVELPERPEPRDRWLTRQRSRSPDPRRADAAGAALYAAVHPDRPLHWPAQGGDPVAALAAGGPGSRHDQFRGRRPQAHQQEARHCSDPAAAFAASAASQETRDRSWAMFCTSTASASATSRRASPPPASAPALRVFRRTP